MTTPYYVDNVNGNDATGTGTSLLPWKTFGKVGKAASEISNGLQSASIIVHIVGNYTGDIVVSWQMVDEATCTILGARTNGYASHFTSKQDPAPGVIGSGGAYPELTDTSTDFSSVVGSHFLDTTVGGSSNIGIIAGVVAGSSNHSIYYLGLSGFGWSARDQGAPGATDAYQIYSLNVVTGQLKVGPMTYVVVQDLKFDTSATSMDTVSARDCSFLITDGCHFKGKQSTMWGGYWQCQLCTFEFSGTGGVDQNCVIIGTAGFFDNFGNVFINGFLEMTGGSDVVGNTIVTGTDVGLAMAFGANLRFPFGTNQSGWLCFIEPTVYSGNPYVVGMAGNSLITCEQNSIWGHIAGSPQNAIQLSEGSRIYYNANGNSPSYIPALSGFTGLMVDCADQGWAIPCDVDPHGGVYEMGTLTRQSGGVTTVTGTTALSIQQLMANAIEVSGSASGTVAITASGTPSTGFEWTCHNGNTGTSTTTFFGITLAVGKSMRVRYTSAGTYQQITAAF